jgi:predicted enzyme related to lactoylglutathione lyase
LEGAILGIRWHNLPDKDKSELKEFYAQWIGTEGDISK